MELRYELVCRRWRSRRYSTAGSSLILRPPSPDSGPCEITINFTQNYSSNLRNQGSQEDRGSGEEATAVQDGGGVGALDSQAGMDERVPLVAPSAPENEAGEGGNAVEEILRDSAYQRYDIQQVARWIEQVLPFSLLLLVVFIRQHLQDEFFAIEFHRSLQQWIIPR